MSDIDERLERIEHQIKILLERQRLSRFDNLMFLLYPLVISGIGLSLTLSLQYETMKTIMIWGVSLARILETLRFAYVLVPAMIFASFCIGYAADDLPTRLKSLEMLLFVLLYLPSLFFGLFLIDQIMPPGLPNAIFVVLLPIPITLLLLSDEAAERIAGRVASWFERNTPIVVEASRGRLQKYHGRSDHLIVKMLWSVSFLMYFMILAIIAWRGQLIGETGRGALYLAVFFVITEAIMLWRL